MEHLQTNPFYRMYNNLFHFMEYRNFEPKTPKVNDGQFIKELRRDEYVMIHAVGKENSRIPDANIFIFLIDEGSEYGKTASKFEMLEYFIKRKKKERVHIIVVTQDSPSIHLRRKISAFKKENIYITVYDYDKFKCVIPEVPIVPKHEIVPADQVEKVLAEEKITDVNQLPKIKESDPMSVWLGILKGDIVKITGPSESAGERISYRLCI